MGTTIPIMDEETGTVNSIVHSHMAIKLQSSAGTL